MHAARITLGPGGAKATHGLHGLLAGTAITIISVTMLATGAGAVEPTNIPTAAVGVAASRCTVGQTCTFAAPIFACDYAGAEKIAAAGPKKGSEIGAGLVREKSCQTVAAGRPLATEATKSGLIVYLTEGGQHLGYTPAGIFALTGSGGQAACDQPGFCSVRPGAQVWLCPTVEDLALPTSEAKSAAKCLRISDSNAGEVTSVGESTVTLANMFGGKPPYSSVYHAARRDLVRLDLQPYPTPAARGWCRPETWCVTAASALFCTDRAAPARIEAAPPGEPRRLAVQAEPGCRFVVGGGVLKPMGLPVAGDAQKLVAVEHPTLGAGWANATAFPVVAYHPPMRDVAQMSEIVVGMARAPAFAAIDIRAQGTSAATGVFRAGPRERREFCKTYWQADQTEGLNSCLSEPDATLKVAANCEARQVVVSGRRYGMLERPRDAAPDIHIDERRKMLYRDLASGEWLDGSTVSGEAMVMTALNALCPGVDTAASYGMVYRDPQAVYPRELWGRWFDNRRACADPGRNAEDYEEHGVMMISERERGGNRDFEFPQRINAMRRLGPQAWQIDGSHRIDAQDVPEIFGTATYTLTHDGIALTREGAVSRWVRCR